LPSENSVTRAQYNKEIHVVTRGFSPRFFLFQLGRRIKEMTLENIEDVVYQ